MKGQCKACKHFHAKGTECTKMRQALLTTPVGPVMFSAPCVCKVGA